MTKDITLFRKSNGQRKMNTSKKKTNKKKVSFADTAGLTLENVKTIPPYIEDVMTGDNTLKDINCSLHLHSLRRRKKYLSPSFGEPCKADSFIERVYRQNVCLQSVSCHNLLVKGVIRVTNIVYAKEVTVRFTLDEWKSFRDVWADYLSTNVDEKTEQFSFRITVPVEFDDKLEIEFAIRYCVGDQEFWDNNFGRNYHIQCHQDITKPAFTALTAK